MQLISSAGLFGAESVTLELTEELNRRGITCELGVFENTQRPNLEVAREAQRRSLPCRVFRCRGQVDPRAVLELRRVVRAEQVEIVHSHGAKSNIYNLLGAAGSARSVATCHNWIGSGWKIRTYNTIDKLGLRFLARVATVSDEVRQEALRFGVDPQNVNRSAMASCSRASAWTPRPGSGSSATWGYPPTIR